MPAVPAVDGHNTFIQSYNINPQNRTMLGGDFFTRLDAARCYWGFNIMIMMPVCLAMGL